MAIYLAVFRHQDKEKRKVISGSNEDRDLVGLNSKGIVNSQILGKDRLFSKVNDLGKVYVFESPFKRVKETVSNAIYGAYHRVSGPSITRQQRINLSFYGMDFNQSGFPNPYKEDFLVEFAEKNYFSEGIAPSMAEYVFGTTDALVTGVKMAIDESSHVDGDQIILLATHSDIIDSLAGRLTGQIKPDVDKRVGVVDQENFPGAYGVGEIISGNILCNRSGNPSVHFLTDKGDKGRYNLDDLCRMRDESYNHTRM